MTTILTFILFNFALISSTDVIDTGAGYQATFIMESKVPFQKDKLLRVWWDYNKSNLNPHEVMYFIQNNFKIQQDRCKTLNCVAKSVELELGILLGVNVDIFVDNKDSVILEYSNY